MLPTKSLWVQKHILLGRADMPIFGRWVQNVKLRSKVFTEFQKNIGKSHSATLEAKKCFPGWRPRNGAWARMPGTVVVSGCACANRSFFLQKACRIAVGAQPTRHVCYLLYVYLVVLLQRKKKSQLSFFFLELYVKS